MKEKYYSLKDILKVQAHYYLIVGERSNGKTTACLEYALKDYLENGNQTAYFRRWEEDIRGSRGDHLFDYFEQGWIQKATKDRYNKIRYYKRSFWLIRVDEETGETLEADTQPFAFAFALSQMEHDKSTSRPKIRTIVFDEFISRSGYLGNDDEEFITFCNCVSTIVRRRDDIKIFMLGNTINKFCPYFHEMGLKHIEKMKKGSIDVYNYGDSKLKVAVELCDTGEKNKKESNVYFAFDNPKLQMITNGEWEIDIYPHIYFRPLPREILFRYYIKFDDQTLECQIIHHEKDYITFIKPKTTPINERNTIVYSDKFNPSPYYRKSIFKCATDIEKKIAWFFEFDKVCYSTNDVGEIVRNYLQYCRSI